MQAQLQQAPAEADGGSKLSDDEAAADIAPFSEMKLNGLQVQLWQRSVARLRAQCECESGEAGFAHTRMPRPNHVPRRLRRRWAG